MVYSDRYYQMRRERRGPNLTKRIPEWQRLSAVHSGVPILGNTECL